MGKTSKRKSQRRQGIGPSRAELERRRDYQILLAGAQALYDTIEAGRERGHQAKVAWADGSEPPRAELGHWREDSMGDRFFSQEEMTRAADALRLADVKLPSPQQMAENPGHWAVAMAVLIRAVVLDGVPVDDPAIAPVLDLLLPAVRYELAVEDGMDDTGFPETDAPLFRLGACALVDATWAIVGLDSLDHAVALMERPIDEALGFPLGKVIAEDLVRAFPFHYQCQEPSDAQTLERLGRGPSGNPLINLIHARKVAPEDILRVGLIVLAALADLARTDADSPK